MVLVVPHSAVDLAAVCDCGITRLCSLTFSKRNLIKGHLLKSNVGSDICFAIMNTLHRLYKCSNELANFTNSITGAEEIYWT